MLDDLNARIVPPNSFSLESLDVLDSPSQLFDCTIDFARVSKLTAFGRRRGLY
jgi:hypothetical protein